MKNLLVSHECAENYLEKNAEVVVTLLLHFHNFFFSRYPIMKTCWSVSPSERPSFKELADLLETAYTGFYENIDVHNPDIPTYTNINPKQPSIFRQESTLTGTSSVVMVDAYENMQPKGRVSPEDDMSLNPAYVTSVAMPAQPAEMASSPEKYVNYMVKSDSETASPMSAGGGPPRQKDKMSFLETDL